MTRAAGIFMLMCVAVVARAQDVLDKVTDASCACMTDVRMEELDHDAVMMQFGLCMISSAQPYEKELKKKYNVDFSKLDGEAGEKLGEMVGMRMAMKCPDMLMKLTALQEQAPAAAEATIASFHGKVMNVRDRQFSTVLVKDASGRTIEFLRLEHFQNADLLNGATAMDLTGTFHFVVRELFDPVGGIYRAHNILVGLDPE